MKARARRPPVSRSAVCRWTVALLCIVASSVADAQPLDSLVLRAIETYPSVEAARLAIERADALSRSAAAWSAPSVGVQFADLPASNPNPYAKGEVMLMVEQMIPLFGQNKAMARAMAIGADVSRASLANIRRDLRLRVEREYYTLWLLDRRVEVNAENRNITELLYRTAEIQYETNRNSQSDLLRIRIEQEQLENELQVIAQDRAAATARLNALLGRSPEDSIHVERFLPQQHVAPLEELEERISGHPKLKEMEEMVRMADAQALAEESMLKPMLMLRGGLGYMPEGGVLREGAFQLPAGEHESQTGAVMEPMRFAVTLNAMVTLPFLPWSSAGPSERAEAYRLESHEKLREREAMRLEMLAMLRTAIEEANRARLRHEFYRDRQIPLLVRTLESLRIDYAVGRIPFSAVADGYTMLVMGRMDAYMQEMEYAMALAMIAQVSGWPAMGGE